MRLPLAPSHFPTFDTSRLADRLRALTRDWRAPPADAVRVGLVFATVYAATWLTAMVVALATLNTHT